MKNIKSKFNQHLGKLINAQELADRLKKTIQAENNVLTGFFKLAAMRPNITVQDIASEIHHQITYSNNPEARNFIYFSADAIDDPRNYKLSLRDYYLDGMTVCELVTGSSISKWKQEKIIKAVAEVSDHAEQARAGLIKRP